MINHSYIEEVGIYCFFYTIYLILGACLEPKALNELIPDWKVMNIQVSVGDPDPPSKWILGH